MANHHLTGMLVNGPLSIMPAQAAPLFMPAQTSLCVMPAQAGIQSTSTVMPAKAGIHSSRTEHWIPACAGMTNRECFDRFDAARREAARLAADAEDMAALEQTERQLEGTRRGKKK